MTNSSVDVKGKGVDRSGKPDDGAKTVTFSEDTKPPAPEGAAAPEVKQESQDAKAAEEKVDGVIGQLEVYQSGAVKMRLSNGIVLDVRPMTLFLYPLTILNYSRIQVNAATQPSFLQHAVYLNPEEKRLCVLGHVNRRFVVSPDIDTLLTAMEQAEQPEDPEIEGLISMDTA